MATPVACGWAGAVLELTEAFGQEQWIKKKYQKDKKGSVKMRLTDWPTDEPTAGVELRIMWLKISVISSGLLSKRGRYILKPSLSKPDTWLSDLRRDGHGRGSHEKINQTFEREL